MPKKKREHNIVESKRSQTKFVIRYSHVGGYEDRCRLGSKNGQPPSLDSGNRDSKSNYRTTRRHILEDTNLQSFLHHHWQKSPFWAIAFLKRFCQVCRPSGFHVFEFHITEKGCHPCVEPPTWRTRSPYLCSPVTGWLSYTPRYRVPFSSLSTTLRAAVKLSQHASTRDLKRFVT
jgi:hypothetical protein